MTKTPLNLDFLLKEASFIILEDLASFRSKLITDLRLMKIEGHIYEAANLKSAYEITSNKKIDFIISDWNLPDGSGLDFLKNLRTDPVYKNTPFLMWTTQNEVKNIIDAITAGATEYICKPWTHAELEEKILLSWGKIYGINKN